MPAMARWRRHPPLRTIGTTDAVARRRRQTFEMVLTLPPAGIMNRRRL